MHMHINIYFSVIELQPKHPLLGQPGMRRLQAYQRTRMGKATEDEMVLPIILRL